jgi:cytochrome c
MRMPLSRLALAAVVALASVAAFAQNTLAKGDATRGEDAYTRLCTGCHSIDNNQVGPRHRGVVGRRVGTEPGFDYSPALATSKLVWDATLLDKWLTDPEVLIKGQRMGFRVSSEQIRADVIAYLATQSALSMKTLNTK